MAHYLPHTSAEREHMLSALGLADMGDLFADIPDSVLLQTPLDLPAGASEMEALEAMKKLARLNHPYCLTLRGAGCYDHFIPPIVSRLAAKDEFVTAYTPYQAEMSQGILQSIFEFQSLICELSGMDASNASLYDGATAAAEAAVMCRERDRSVTLVSAAAHPDTLATLRTYCYGTGDGLRTIPLRDGVIDLQALKGHLTDDVACLYVQQPNFYGLLENVGELFATAKAAGVKCVLGINPMTLACLPSGKEVGADIVCGDAQPFGLPMAYGGPSLGFIAATVPLQRRLPGRIVGQTLDSEGRRAFVLTLQAREQHIRREKAASNICSNQAHCALTASIYMTYMGVYGLKQVAESCISKAHYLAQRLCAVSGVSMRYPGAFFHEFVTTLPVEPRKIEEALEREGVLSGLPLEGGDMLWCVTEKAGRAELDRVADCVGGACAL